MGNEFGLDSGRRLPKPLVVAVLVIGILAAALTTYPLWITLLFEKALNWGAH